MTQYINKSALVAELNRLIAELVEEGEDTMFEQGRISAFEDVKVFINHILEVKEVDLEKENFIKKEIGYIKGYREKAIKMLDELKDSLEEERDCIPNSSKVTVGTKIRLKTNPDVILSIISDDCHGDEFECSNGSVLSLKQIEKYYDIII